MVTSISLGNFFQSNGRTVVGGLGGSGLDTESLIKSLVDAKAIPKTKIEANVTQNDAKLTALADLKTLLSTFKDATNFLRNPPGVQNASDNVFAYRTANVSSSTSVAGTSYLTVNAEPGASAQTYSVTDITSVARAKKQSSNDFAIASADTSVVTAAATAGFFKAGDVVVNGQTISLSENDSLNNVVAKFNEKSEDTGIQASVLQVSTGHYSIIFSATDTGTANDFDLDNAGVATVTDPDGVLSNITFTDGQGASNASFVLDGQTIIRSTNSISDVISGLTFTILQATPLPLQSTTITVDVVNDTSIAKSGVINFANAYNDLRLFLSKQSETDPKTGNYVDTAVLASNSTFRALINNISNEVSNTVSGLTDYDTLSDIGITFVDLPESEDQPFTRNVLNVDEKALENALSGYFTDVQALFGFTYSSNNSNFRIFSHTNALTATSFTVNANPGTSTFTATVGGDTVTLTGTSLASGGWSLTAPSGSALEGLKMIYASGNTATIAVSATQGIADRLFNFLDATLKSDTGTLAVEITGIKDRSTRYGDEIARIDDQLATYRDQLLIKFGALESLLSSVNTLLTSLQAQSDARKYNS